MKPRLCQLALAGLCALPAIAAATTTERVAELAATEKVVSGAREALQAKANIQQEIEGMQDELVAKLYMVGVMRSFVGDEAGAMAAYDEVRQIVKRPHKVALDDRNRAAVASSEDALTAIVNAARGRRIVILNEAHQVPVHRAFAMRLARELRKLGFQWLACETLFEAPMAKGYVADSTGFYSREPVFGNFLRDAVADGWQLVPYEAVSQDPNASEDERTEFREAGQARKLFDRILAKDPAAKVFVYVGHSHVNKKPTVGMGLGRAWMAAQLASLSGLDPLTIDQTDMMGHPHDTAEFPRYADIVRRENRRLPFVLRSPAGEFEVFGDYRYAVDIQVVHPRYGIDSTTLRPAWMRELAGFTAVDIPQDLRPASGAHYVYARREGEPDDAVPLDIVKLEAGKPAPKFLLPAGRYSFSVVKTP